MGNKFTLCFVFFRNLKLYLHRQKKGIMVAKIKRVLKNTRGVFLPRPSSYQKKDVSSIRYLDSSNDRKNLRGD